MCLIDFTNSLVQLYVTDIIIFLMCNYCCQFKSISILIYVSELVELL